MGILPLSEFTKTAYKILITFTDVSSGIFNSGVSVGTRQAAQTESIRVVGGVGKSVNNYAGLGRMEDIPYPGVQLVIFN